ncbi:TetR/AcrR family transcriptional regulator [Streptomyces caniferus]|uniref:TetR/AcrR family transcriptional regulator n=1 Tax=Streptomyces caniferus TaxID=285557 RepID=UPI003452967D
MLYSHFRSKEELVTAALERQHTLRRSHVEAHLTASQKSPAAQLIGLFDWLDRWHRANGCRGCAFLNAAPELVGPQKATARDVVRRHKHWWQQLLTSLAQEAGAEDPGQLAEELLLLLDGASFRVLVEGSSEPVRVARRIAEKVLARAGLHGQGE